MKSLITTLFVFLCLCAQAQVAIYKYAETGTVTGDFQTFRVLYSGYVILDLQTGGLSGVQTFASDKQYTDLDLSTLALSQIHSKTSHYSVFHDAYSGTNNVGDPIVIFSWFKGLNSSVDVGDVSRWQIPRTLQISERWVYWQDGEQQFEEDTGALTIDLKNSMNSNKAGDDAAAAVDRIKVYLQGKGYTEAPQAQVKRVKQVK
jgi:hypothetical protein